MADASFSASASARTDFQTPTTKRPTPRAVIKAEQEAASLEARATAAERQRIAYDQAVAATARLTAAAAGPPPACGCESGGRDDQAREGQADRGLHQRPA